MAEEITQWFDGSAPNPGHLTATYAVTLRDYFAAKAMQSLIAYDAQHGHEFGWNAPDKVVALAYVYADAALIERAK